MIDKLNEDGFDYKESGGDEDIIADYKNLMKVLYSKLDPSIRVKLNKSGVAVISGHGSKLSEKPR